MDCDGGDRAGWNEVSPTTDNTQDRDYDTQKDECMMLDGEFKMSDDEDEIDDLHSGFLRDATQELAVARRQLEEQEQRFLDAKKVQQHALQSTIKYFGSVERKLEAQMDHLNKQHTRYEEQEARLGELLTKAFDEPNDNTTIPKCPTTSGAATTTGDAASPPPKRTKTSEPPAAIVPIRALPARKASIRPDNSDHPAIDVAPTNQTSKKTKAPAKERRVPTTRRDAFEHGADIADHDRAAYSYPGRWDVARCGHFNTISNDGRIMVTDKHGWNVVLGSEPADRFSVLVKFPSSKQKNSVAIGLTSDTSLCRLSREEAQQPFGFNERGWFLNVQLGKLCSKAGHDNARYTQRFHTGDRLTVELDPATRRMSFYKNGKHLGVAYTDVHETKMYPVVISYDKGVKVSFE
ncbi:Aste57867_11336 [Aphanomyces stellatus]|uniref:Aste57867_11336 protein n=1 Tax=Aphanomyces stellatus TaxID=120398 RepID=A0A485KT83_9STRA|nr:hypothetical protein As57867_011294 [Aphanomyces stellatus]VFT88198.1 Aste57867_11336 [Aphanomyces stellatus]